MVKLSETAYSEVLKPGEEVRSGLWWLEVQLSGADLRIRCAVHSNEAWNYHRRVHRAIPLVKPLAIGP
jgi:hypothetical protein